MVKKDNPTVLLIDATPDCVTDGIFTKLTNPPWADLNLSPQVLNSEYYLAHSGKKPVAPIVHYYLDDDNEITAEGMTALGALIKAKFYEPWTHLMDTYYAEYNPLNNYSITEQEAYEEDNDKSVTDETTYGKTVNTLDNLTHGKTVSTVDELTHGKKVVTTNERDRTNSETTSTTVTYGKTETTNIENDTTQVDNERHGFNSTTGVPTDSSTSVRNAENSVHSTGSDGGITRVTATDNDDTEVNEQASGKDTRSISEMDGGTDSRAVGETHGGTDSTEIGTEGHIEGTRSKNRSGLNGLNSYQRMIAEDRKLWLDNFFDRVYHDIDTILTLPIYPSKRRLQSWVWNSGYPNR